jgi:hypothetical protein
LSERIKALAHFIGLMSNSAFGALAMRCGGMLASFGPRAAVLRDPTQFAGSRQWGASRGTVLRDGGNPGRRAQHDEIKHSTATFARGLNSCA